MPKNNYATEMNNNILASGIDIFFFFENVQYILIAIPYPPVIFDQKWEMNLIKTHVPQDWYLSKHNYTNLQLFLII